MSGSLMVSSVEVVEVSEFEDERPLGEAPSAPVEVEASVGVDVSEPVPAPEDFDMRSWLAGVRPTRRAVKLFPSAHLLAEMDRVVDAIDASPAGADVDVLIDEFEALKHQFNEGVWFVVEKRSEEWLRAERKRIIKALKLDAATEGDAIRLGYEVVAGQVVSPRVSGADLAALAAANEGEAVKVLQAAAAVNNQLAEDAGVLTRDFSSRRSARL